MIERAGLGHGGPGVGPVPAGAQHHHGLGAGGGPGRRHEPAGIGHPVEAEQDRPGPVIGGEIVEAVGHADIEDAAERQHRGEAGPVPGGPFDDGGRHRAGLRDQREVPRRRGVSEQAGIELGAGHRQAGAVGSEAAQAQRPGDPVRDRAGLHLGDGPSSRLCTVYDKARRDHVGCCEDL